MGSSYSFFNWNTGRVNLDLPDGSYRIQAVKV